MPKPQPNPLFTRAEKKRMGKVARHTARKGIARLFGIPLSQGLGAPRAGGRKDRRARTVPSGKAASPPPSAAGVRGDVLSGLVNMGFKKSVAEKMVPHSVAGESFDSLFRRSVAKNPAELIIFGNPEKVYRKKNVPLGILEGIGFAIGEHLGGRVLKSKPRKRLQTAKARRKKGKRNGPRAKYEGYRYVRKSPRGTISLYQVIGGRVKRVGTAKSEAAVDAFLEATPPRPNPDSLGQAKDLYRDFHKRPASGVYELQIDAKRRKDFTILGPLAAIGVNAEKFDRLRPREEDVVEHWDKLPNLEFLGSADRRRVMQVLGEPNAYLKQCPLLASSPNGRQLYVISSDPLTLDLSRFDTDTQKDFVDLGEATFVVYIAKKPSQPLEWVHTFAEDGGQRPRLTYSRLSKEIFFTGGSYRVEAPGIIN